MLHIFCGCHEGQAGDGQQDMGRKLVHVELVQPKEKRQAQFPRQRKGSITPSIHQVPAAIPVVDTVPDVHSVPVVDSVPVGDTVPVVEIVQETDAVPVVDSVPAINTAPTVEGVPDVVSASTQAVSAPVASLSEV